jgi:hypothetical protein
VIEEAMKKLALLQLLLLPLAGFLHDVHGAAALQSTPAAVGGEASAAPAVKTTATAAAQKPSAACTPWTPNFWGDVRIASQVDADEYACFRRIVGSVTLVQSKDAPIVLPKLHGVVGDLRIAFTNVKREKPLHDPSRALAEILPMLEDVTGNVELEYARGDAALHTVLPRGYGKVAVRGEFRVAFRRVEIETASSERALLP